MDGLELGHGSVCVQQGVSRPGEAADACAGEWGFGYAREPGSGTRMWAVLPRDGARGYLGDRGTCGLARESREQA